MDKIKFIIPGKLNITAMVRLYYQSIADTAQLYVDGGSGVFKQLSAKRNKTIYCHGKTLQENLLWVYSENYSTIREIPLELLQTGEKEVGKSFVRR